jgi:transposase
MVHTNTILAVDLGKFKSVCCWYDLATKATTFRTIATSPSELRDAIQRQPNVTVVIEACSPAGWVSDLCESLGVPLLVANTNGEAWAWKNVKRKTDRDDALKLARMCAVGELRTVTVPSRATRQYKSLIGLRKRLVGERVRGQNRLRGLLVGQGLPAPRGAKAWTELGLKGLETLAMPLDQCASDE